MAPAKILNLRGGSVSPHARPYNTSMIKVGGEVFDRDGYRMDVTVWFRHRNEVLYYLDSGGSVHGPMDQKHSTRLGNISRSGQLIPGSRYYLGDTGARSRLYRRQSESGVWDTRSESYFRGRTLSESRRPYLTGANADERSTFRHYSYSQSPAHYRTTTSHHIGSALSPAPTSHISRWSSMQGASTHGLWRGSSGNRYATTLTRQHIKRHRDPIEMVVKAPSSRGASKVDLVSIDNRQIGSPPAYSPNTFAYSHYEADASNERIRRLQDELSTTRRELQELKRSCSLTGEQHLLSPSTAKHNIKSTSTQYLNESAWATHTLSKNEGMPCGARITTTPHRATSQTNLTGRTNLGQQPWSSEVNVRTFTNYKTPPGMSTYSAHRENLLRKEDNRRFFEDGTSRHYTSRGYEESKGTGTAEILEEMETITLQPIGRGVHDLEPVRSIARSYRANTPTVSRALTPGPDMSDGYRTIATTNLQREIHSPGAQSPFIGTRYNSLYETKTLENHLASSPYPEQQWRASTVPPNYAASTSGVSGFAESTDWEQGLMKVVRETYRDWYMPDKKREDVHFLLRDREPGAFIIRNSVSCPNSFSLGVKSPPLQTPTPTHPEYMKSGPVKHFMIQTIPMPDGRTEGVQLRGFEDQPIFPGLVQFVHHHCLHPGPLPCQLQLPVGSMNSQVKTGAGYFGSLNKYGQHFSVAAGRNGMMSHMLYLGSVNVDRLENEAAVRRAITHILTQAAININKLTKRCEATVTADPQDGVRIHDRAQRGLLEKHIKPSQIVYCGLDPESRLYTDQELKTRGIYHARPFGLVVRKKQFWMHGNMVYVLAEIDPSQSAFSLVQYINQVLINKLHAQADGMVH